MEPGQRSARAQVDPDDVDRYRVDFVNQENQSRWIEIRGQDFHAMGKKQLGAIVASNA